MKVENFSDEKVREMAENVRLDKITIPQSSFNAMKARCALFDELVVVVKISLPVLEGSLTDPAECATRFVKAIQVLRKAEEL